MKWLFVIFGILAIVFFMFGRRAQDVSQNEGDARDGITTTGNSTPAPQAELSRPTVSSPTKSDSISARTQTATASSGKTKSVSEDTSSESAVRDYVVEDGVAVIEGDIVIGLPGSSGRAAQVPKITPWPSPEIPIFIQPSVTNPERITEALTYFDPTVVRFIPYSNQRDVLVFENGSGRCKSYMGKIGGKQPIYLAANCGPHEIAHEIMHALGFIHEQNRNDRDSAIRVNRDNIEGTALMNFEKLPRGYMTLTGLAPFDFTSLMLYPPSMFSRNGEPTITATSQETVINPSERLSASDIARINSFYGSR